MTPDSTLAVTKTCPKDGVHLYGRMVPEAEGKQGHTNVVRGCAPHVATSANNVVQWAGEAIAVARQIQSGTELAATWALARQLNKLASELTLGVDANGDGSIGWQEGEGGLQQAEQHANLMKKGEGLP